MKSFLLAATACLIAVASFAYHGWSSFDQDRPVYLQGTIKSVRWTNPHAEAVIQVAPDVKLPADLAARPLPKQSQQVDAAGITSKTQLPADPAGEWQLEFAPLTRMQAWGMAASPKVGDRVEVIGYTGPTEGGRRVLRTEFLFLGGKTAALRSGPAN